MICPNILFDLGSIETDDVYLGRILRASCGQDVELTTEQQRMVRMIEMESRRMDEAWEKRRENERIRKAEYRKKHQMSQGQVNVPGTSGTSECPSPSAESGVIINKEIDKEINKGGLNSVCDNARATHHPPSKEQVQMVATANHISKEFTDSFYEDMVCDRWQYINNAGATVEVTARNVGIVLRGRWRNFKARQEKSGKTKPTTNQPVGVNHQEDDYDYSKFGE